MITAIIELLRFVDVHQFQLVLIYCSKHNLDAQQKDETEITAINI